MSRSLGTVIRKLYGENSPGRTALLGGLAGLAVMAAVIYMLQTGGHHRVNVHQPLHSVPPESHEITLYGRIQATKVVKVAAPVDGTVERFTAEPGDEVFEGQLLAMIESPKYTAKAKAAETEAVQARNRLGELEAGLMDARLEASRSRADATRTKAELELAQKTYERQKLLYDQGATPRLTWEKAEAEHKRLQAEADDQENAASAAEARIASISKELDSTRVLAQQKTEEMDETKADLGMGEVHSPVDGVVISRHGQAGDTVSSQTADLFVLGANLNELEVVVKPDASALSRIKVGAPAQIGVSEFPRPIDGLVREIAGGEVIVEFKNPDPDIKPGLDAQVRLKM